jgi:hypothetical protein
VTTRSVWLEGRRVELAAAALLGQGGEAEVYRLPDDRALKWWKPPDHPDFAGDAAAGAAAARRIDELQRKLAAFPAGLPARVVAPGARATASKRSTHVVGFAMARARGVPLHHLGEVRWRRDAGVELGAVAAALVDLHATVTAIHAAGAVIGDFNDLDVLVDPAACRAVVIDADSFQLPGFPCALFSHRFVDPRLCDPAAAAPALIRPHDRDGDWFAFAVMAFRSLLGVSPYGGVHRPADVRRTVPAAARSLRGTSVFDPEVVYPRAALPWTILPDDTVAAFHRVFVAGGRGVFPRRALDGLRFTRCASCGAEHAHAACPACRSQVSVPVTVHGELRVTEIALADVRRTTWELGGAELPGAPPVWIAGDAIVRRTPLGVERIGGVLAGQTRAWVGASLGLGFYRAGGLTVGFVFRPDRRGLDDRVALPPIRGALVAAHAAIAAERGWLALVTAFAGRLTTTLIAIDARGQVVATHASDGADWLAGIAGACAVGDLLFVPTDDGIVRVAAHDGAAVVTHTFCHTRPVVAAGDAVHPGPDSLDVVRGTRARRLQTR